MIWKLAFVTLTFFFTFNGNESPDEEVDEKHGAKFHRGQANESGYIDKVSVAAHAKVNFLGSKGLKR